MSNIVCLSNDESPLTRLLSKTSSYSPWQYSLKSSVGNYARTRVTIKGDSSPSWGRSYDFQLARYGLLAKATARIVLSVPASTTAQDASKWVGACMIAQASLQNHSKIIESYSYQYAIARAAFAKSQSEYETMAALLYATPTNADFTRPAATAVTAGADRDIEVLVPLQFSCFDSPTNYWDTRFCEQLSINLQLPASDTTLFENAGVTIKSFDLNLDFIQMSDEVYKDHVSAQYSLSQPLSVLGSTVYHENETKLTLAAETAHAEQTISVELKAPGVVTHTFFRLINVGAGSTYHLGTGIGAGSIRKQTLATGALEDATDAGWSNVTVRASGVELCSMSQREASLIGFGGGYDRATKTTNNNEDGESQMYCVNWGMDHNAQNYNAGSISLRNLVTPTLTLTLRPFGGAGAPGATPPIAASPAQAQDLRLQVFSKMLSVTNISSSDGRVSSGLAL